MSKVFAARRRALIRLLKEEGVDALLVTGETNVSYLTGFTGDSSWLIVGRSRTLLISDGRYTTQIEEECPGLDAHIRKVTEKLPDATAAIVEPLGGKTLGVEAGSLTLASYEALRTAVKTVELRSTSGLVEQLRAVKDDAEVAAIREAVRVAEAGFAYFKDRIDGDALEVTLAHDLEHVMRQFGAECVSFPPIVAVDDRAALPHYRPGRVRVGDASHVLVDWGARMPASHPLGGYVSDLTRVLVGPKPPKKLVRMYEACLAANVAGVKAARPGANVSAVDAVARKVLEDHGFAKYFTHSLGHGLGRDVHEAPRLAGSSDDVLQPGMVITIEPGIYIPGYGGIRIEDDVLVTESGREVLSSVPKDLDANFVTW